MISLKKPVSWLQTIVGIVGGHDLVETRCKLKEADSALIFYDIFRPKVALIKAQWVLKQRPIPMKKQAEYTVNGQELSFALVHIMIHF